MLCRVEDKFKEECGVFGFFNRDSYKTSKITYYGLQALQHRGQESAGIAVSNGEDIVSYKQMGLVTEIFNEEILKRLQGHISVGHVRYSTTGSSFVTNAQPLSVRFKSGYLALAHNGNLINADELRSELEDKGNIFQTTTDSEVILHLISKYHSLGLISAIKETMKLIKGSYALVLMTKDKLIGIRDPNGIRPLSLGLLGNSYCLASETCAFDTIGAEFIRDVEPGEILVIDEKGLTSERFPEGRSALCIFEFIYFARPDSNLNGINVYIARKALGRRLAEEHPADADLVIPVPDSGNAAAMGYAERSGIPFAEGLVKNKYVGRTFIEPNQKDREIGVRLKLNVIKDIVRGKRIVIVDDSIVRGTTSKRIIDALRSAGAKEVHVRVSSPPVKFPCYFGIDTPTKKELVGSTKTVKFIRDMIGADSLGYLSIEGMLNCFDGKCKGFCTACFSGDYPMEVPAEGKKYLFEKR